MNINSISTRLEVTSVAQDLEVVKKSPAEFQGVTLPPAAVSKSTTDAADMYLNKHLYSGEVSVEVETKISYAISHRATDIMDIIMAALNQIRGEAHQMIKNRAQEKIAFHMQAAQETRNEAREMLNGAIAGVVLSGAGAVASFGSSAKSLSASGKASESFNTLSSNDKRLDTIAKDLKADKYTGKSLTDVLAERKSLRQAKCGLNQGGKIHNQAAQSAQALASSILGLGQATSHTAESIANSRAKGYHADNEIANANASQEQATQDAAQKLNADMTKVFESLISAFKEMRDVQDQTKANIARNA